MTIQYRDFLKLLQHQKQLGFTLIELLSASIMTLFVVSATGYAMFTVMKESVISGAASDLQKNIDRATAFIADDIKEANFIYQSKADIQAAVAANSGNFNASGKTIALAIDKGYAAPVIYYIKSAASPWLGPKVLYRWGPAFNADGVVTITNASSPDNWGGRALVDRVATSSSGTCSIGSTVSGSGTAAAGDGFFVCFDPSTQKEAEIHLFGSQEAEFSARGLDTNEASRTGGRANYAAVTKVFVRSTDGVVAYDSSGNLSILEPAVATLTSTSCASSLTVNFSGTSTTWNPDADGPLETGTIFPSDSPVLSIDTYTFSDGTADDNKGEFSVTGGCTIDLTLDNP